MSLVVTGSIGIDSVQTPHGRADEVLGGSAVYFAFSSALFSPVALVGVVGEDFPETLRSQLRQREIDLSGLETRAGSRTFRWSGKYEGSMNEAETLSIDLNVLAERAPAIPDACRGARFVFLANTHPDLQQSMAREFSRAQLIVCDTRDLWITTERQSLARLLGMVTGVALNDGEARLLTGESNLILAGRRILEYGPRFVIIKKGEHGALLCTRERILALPGFPTEQVKDPTGAGDSFAGGMMGYLASRGEFLLDDLPRAMGYGTVAASFAIESFSLAGLAGITRSQLDQRFREYAAMLALS